MSKDNKNIDQLINQSFIPESSDFDFSSWTKLKEQLPQSKTVDQAIKGAFTIEKTILPEDAWAQMNDQLDIETVWSRLSNKPSRKPIIFYWKVATIISLVGLISFGFYQMKLLSWGDEILL